MPTHHTILTLFPEAITPYAHASILGKAQANGLLKVSCVNIRDFATDTHKTTDDTPYGGGAGMVMKIEPIYRALASLGIAPEKTKRDPNGKVRVVLLSAKGQPYTQTTAKRLAAIEHLILICGRYEGVDERVAQHLADEELSIGNYIVSGGELPALIVVDSVARLIPGVLGNPASLTEESFTTANTKEYPHYTKPEVFHDWSVPGELLSGNHKTIREWRDTHARPKNDD